MVNSSLAWQTTAERTKMTHHCTLCTDPTPLSSSRACLQAKLVQHGLDRDRVFDIRKVFLHAIMREKMH